MSSSCVRFTSADNATRMPCTSGRPETNRPGFRYGHGSRDGQHLQRAQLLVGDLAVGPPPPLTGRTGSQTLRSLRPDQRGLEDLGEHQRVVERVVRPHLADAPVRGQRLQPQVLAAEVEPAGQLDRAHHGVDRQLHLGQFGLGGQERVVEADVVGHQGASAQHVDQVGSDVGEARLARRASRRSGRAHGWARVDTGIQQGGDAALDVAVVTEGQCGDADDAGLPRPEAGRLDVDDSPARAGFGCRPAPGVAHIVRMARRSDIPSGRSAGDRRVSGT